MTNDELIKKWIDDMVSHGFMQGWGGDKSDAFKQSQIDCINKVLNGDVQAIGGNYRLLATIHSDYGNLKSYCKWPAEDLLQFLELFNFKDIRHVIAVMNAEDRNRFMEGGKLKDDVRFILTPII